MTQISVELTSWLFLIFTLNFSTHFVLPVVSESTSEDVARPLNRYAVVVDCGSSGSRAHIYHWQVNTSDENVIVEVRPLRDPIDGKPLKVSIKPGLASVRDSPESASDYMKPIMNFLSQNVPSEAQTETPVYFMGTAGLRMLTEGEQRSILNDILRDLSRQYNFPRLSAEVISGNQEGLFQWISVNGHSGRLKSVYDMGTGVGFFCQAPLARRLGVLEVGGASAQVTFELGPELDYAISHSLKHFPSSLEAYRKSQVQIKAGKRQKTVRVFSTSFLGLGTNSARDIAVDLLVREAIKLPTRQVRYTSREFAPVFYSPNSTLLLADPCLPVGAQEDMLKPLELLYNQSRTLDFTPQEGDQTFTVKLLGSGDYYRCRALMSRLLVTAREERLNCEDISSPCFMSLLGTNFVPFSQIQFVGLGDLFYTTDEMIRASGYYDAYLIQRRTAEICATPYDTLLKIYPEANRVDPKRVLLECFKASWIQTWLHLGLKLPRKFAIDFRTINEINGETIDWTLGAVIEKMNDELSNSDSTVKLDLM